MKTASQAKIQLVIDLSETMELRKELEKREKALKAQIREIMGEDSVLQAGNFMVSRSERTRSDLDRDALQHDMGHEFCLKYTKVTRYEIMSVQAISKAEAV